MRALDQEVKDAVWAATEPLLPQRENSHPLGTHRRRVPDRLCFEGILVRLVTGCSWQTAERLLGCAVSDTTLRARRDEWIAAGVFDAVVEEALAAFDRIVGLDLTEVAVDGSAHKAPSGGPGTGRNPTDRGKSGWKWSLLTDRAGIRWPVERTNSWLSNFGQLRRNTDRYPHHRLAQLALAIVLLICIKLIDWRNRWSPPIR